MGFDPLKEKGTPIEKQFRNWSDLNVPTYDTNDVHPYTRTRAILMNGIEVEAAIFKHQFARHCEDIELKQQVAASRRVEQQHQKSANWLIPGNESTLEVTIGFEQVAVDLTAWLARTEPNEHVKAALDFALIEDFDHLYRYANLMEMTEGKQASKNVRDLTEVMPGRPTELEHRHPFDSVRKPVDFKSMDILSIMHILTIVAAEQQTMNFYMNVGNRPESKLGRGLYLEIAQIEEQHVSHYESLIDPKATWFERMLMHEYNECYMYYSCMESEVDQNIKKIWERNLSDEIEHLRIACELLKKHENKDPQELLPDELPELTIFQPNKDYVRDIIETQTNLTGYGTEYMEADQLPEDAHYHEFQEIVNSDFVPSHEVIAQHIESNGEDYRIETEGPHPLEKFRARQTVGV